MCVNTGEWVTNCADPVLIWVCTVCSGLSVQMLKGKNGVSWATKSRSVLCPSLKTFGAHCNSKRDIPVNTRRRFDVEMSLFGRCAFAGISAVAKNKFHPLRPLFRREANNSFDRVAFPETIPYGIARNY